MKVAREITNFKLQEKTYLDHQMLLEEELNELKKIPALAADKNAAAHIDFLDGRISEIRELHTAFKSSYEPLPFRSWEITAKNLHDNGYDDWVRFSHDQFENKFSDEDRKAYEQFVKGYLTHFENTVNIEYNKPARKYTIYFDWGKTREDSALIIYIKYMPHLDEPYYKDYGWYVDAEKKKHLSSGAVLDAQNSPFPPPPSMTDPQPPPPPPKGNS